LVRLPTSTDDVVINLPNIPANVITSSSPAYAKSLTIGGTSTFTQTLTVQGPLYLAGGKILPNGNLYLNSGPDLSLYNTGTFDGANKLIFTSGNLAGPGKYLFTNLNMSGSAEKRINSTVSADILNVEPGRGSTGSINIVGGSLGVTGTFKTSDSVIISSSKGASFDVTGTFSFTAASAAYTATIRGTSNINTLSITAGTVVLADNVMVTSANLAGGTLDLIGSESSQRTFGDITGSGVLKIEGGSNSFTTLTNIGNVQLIGGSLIASSKSATINDLIQSGGVLAGPAPLTIGSGSFANAQISSAQLNVGTFTLNGYTSLSSSTLTITQNGVISKDTQVTLSPKSTFSVGSNAVVSQSAAFEILATSSSTPAPQFQNDGQWTSTSNLVLFVPTSGKGIFQFATGSTTSITGITFSAGSIIATSANFSAIGSSVNVGSIAGTGYFATSGNDFTVTQSINCNTFTQTNGVTKFGNGAITNLNFITGTISVTGPQPPTGPILGVGTFNFQGGIFSSLAETSPVSVSNFILTGTQPKTLNSASLTAGYLELNCGTTQCQLFTESAHLYSGKKVL
jgi:hypothetical protein